MVTPNDIDVLLHYNSSPLPHPRRDAPAVRQAIEWMLSAKILEEGATQGAFLITQRGEVWVKMLCKVPLPVPAWLDADGKLIDLTR